MEADEKLGEIVLEIDTENRLVAEARDKYERGEPVEFNELQRLMEAGIVHPSEIPLQPPKNGSRGR